MGFHRLLYNKQCSKAYVFHNHDYGLESRLHVFVLMQAA